MKWFEFDFSLLLNESNRQSFLASAVSFIRAPFACASAEISAHRRFVCISCNGILYRWCRVRIACVSSNPCCKRMPFHTSGSRMVFRLCVSVCADSGRTASETICCKFYTHMEVHFGGSIDAIWDSNCGWTFCHNRRTQISRLANGFGWCVFSKCRHSRMFCGNIRRCSRWILLVWICGIDCNGRVAIEW